MTDEKVEGNEEDNLIELTDEDGNTEQFLFIGQIEYKEKNYAVLQLADPQTEEEADEVVIYEVKEDGEEMDLEPVDDEKLLDEVFQAFLDEYEQYEDEEEK